MADKNDILAQLEVLVANGTEEEVRAFVKAHFMELPREARENYMVDTLNAALEDATAQRENITKIQEEGIQAWEQLDEIEKEFHKNKFDAAA